MANSFILEKKSLNQWITMGNGPRPEAMIARCNEKAVVDAVKSFNNVKVVSTTMEIGISGWQDNFHVVLEETSPGGHAVTINVWMPLDWNGRFLACVGGGLRTLHLYEILGKEHRIAMPRFVVNNGFATANTDGGVPGEVFSWGLDEETKAVDYELVLNYAYRSTHSMTVIAKAVISAVYGEEPQYSYMQGASGGGRQSLTEAQLYPEDYDGIWAVDPAINFTGLFTSMIWPLAVMNEEKHIITPAKLSFFRKAAIEESGGKYDFIETADMPAFDPDEYIGQQADDGIITQADARVMKLIFSGAKTRDGHFLWYGFRPGTRFWSNGVIGEPGSVPYNDTENGPEPQLNMLANGFIGAWFKRSLEWDWKSLDYRGFEELFKQGLREYACLESNSCDLYDFKRAGKKILVSHAVNDDTIPCDSAVDYYSRVIERMGGEDSVNEFMLLFMSPGGGHTDLKQPGLSFTLADGMIALMNWVENGVAPKEIPGVQYDFEQNEVVLSGTVPVYRLGKSNSAINITVTPAYANIGKKCNATSAGRKFSADSTLAEIIEDEKGQAMLRLHIGALLDNPMFANAKNMTLNSLEKVMPVDSMKEKIRRAINEITQL